MTELPPGWISATVPDLIAPDGAFSDGDWVESKDQDPDGEVRLIQLADIGDGSFRDRSSRFLTTRKASDLGCTYLRPGDVLIARMPDPLGRACVFPDIGQPSVTAVDVCVVRPGIRSVDPRWLMYFVNSPQFRSIVAALQAGTTRKRISRKNLATIPLSMPPLNEQRRIVAAIEEQFSRLDAADSSLAAALRRVGLLRRTAFSLAAEGDWPVARLSEIAEVRLGRQRSPKNHNGPNMRPYLRAANVTWSGLDLADVKQMNFGPHEVATYRLEPGDVLVGEASGSASEVGKTAMWRGEIAECCFQNTLLRVRSARADPEYLCAVLQAAAASGEFGRAAAGVGIHHLGAARLSAWPVPLPPFDEQRRIVAEVEERLSAVEALRAAIERARKRSAALRRSILERAFRGELVPQDPTDEPAEALLARIRAEREAATSATRRTART